MNRAFSAYVTSTAFLLKLTQQQIWQLCRRVDECHSRSCKCDSPMFVASSNALMAKGLFHRVPPKGYVEATEVGIKVHDLLIEAGLCLHRLEDEPPEREED